MIHTSLTAWELILRGNAPNDIDHTVAADVMRDARLEIERMEREQTYWYRKGRTVGAVSLAGGLLALAAIGQLLS